MIIREKFFKVCLITIFIVALSASAWAAPFSKGETIHYNIKKLGMNLGKATLTYNGPSSIYNREAILITFKAEGLNFFDEEKIYMDPITMYPMLVKRDLNIWGKKEVIEEFYDQKNMRVKVVKQAKGKETVTMINKKGKIDNIYCFLYRYRKFGSFKQGDKLELFLPTKDVSIAPKKMTELKAGEKTFKAYYMASTPSKYHLWFDISTKRVPLRIDGAVGIGKTKMIIESYQP